MNIAIVGATGLVGQVILEILEKFEFDLDNIYAIASKKSIGKSIKFRDQEITITVSYTHLTLPTNREV